jgi:hypothetical protein
MLVSLDIGILDAQERRKGGISPIALYLCYLAQFRIWCQQSKARQWASFVLHIPTERGRLLVQRSERTSLTLHPPRLRVR